MVEKKPAYVDFRVFDGESDALSDDDLLEAYSDLEEVGSDAEEFEISLQMTEADAITKIQAVAFKEKTAGQIARNLLFLDRDPGGLADNLSLRSEGV